MFTQATLLAAFALQASAYPFALDGVGKRQAPEIGVPGTAAAIAFSKARKNCGVVPCLVFDEEAQYVSTSGGNAFQAPGAGDIRGLCPGLNAAANHGYLKRDGVTNIVDTIVGLGAAYGMSPDLAGFLAAFAVVFNGDPILQTWSIGGAPPANQLTKTLLGQAQGISNSHNNYEGDVSISRGDAYLNNGDAVTLQLDRFTEAYQAYSAPDRYSLDAWALDYWSKLNQSVAENPYFFSAPFSGLVAPAAYNFVINFMSNHTAEEPNGYLNSEMFKTFFSVEGEPGSFTWTPGHERIPDNWYKRTDTNQYNAVNVFNDLFSQFFAYPDSFKLGGNTGTTNSFVGFNFGDLTGGAINNADDLFQDDNLQCFFANAALAGIPDILNLPLLAAVNDLTAKYFTPLTNGRTCAPIDELNTGLFSNYPGASYSPSNPTKKARFLH